MTAHGLSSIALVLHKFNAQFRAVVPAVANHLWQSTAVAAAAGLLTIALRSNHARVRHCVWIAASLKFLVPFALFSGLAIHLVRATPVANAPETEAYLAVDNFSEPFVVSTSQIAPAIVAPRMQMKEWLPLAAGVLWLGGVSLVASVWSIRWQRIARMVRASDALTDGREVAALRALEHTTKVRRSLRLVLCDSRMEPGVFGILRPVLIWPAGISDRLSDAQLDAVLEHEISHVLRRDNLTAALHMLVEAVFWFHPVVWWIGTRITAERERACDEKVVAICGEPVAYAESILTVCAYSIESPLKCVSGITGADLKQRVVEIMSARLTLRLTLAKKLMLVLFAVCIGAVPVLLGEAQAAHRLMLAVINVAPKPLQVAAHAMIAKEEAPSSAEIAEIGPPTRSVVPVAADISLGPEFEVAVIRPADPNEKNGGNWVTSSGRFEGKKTTVEGLVNFAYTNWQDHEGDQVASEGPPWIGKARFDVEAKLSDAEMVGWTRLSNYQRTEYVKPMLRRLLADRFHVQVRSEQRMTQVYALVLAKGGSKLTEVVRPIGPEDSSDAEMKQKMQDAMAHKTAPIPESFTMSGNEWSGTALPIGMLVGEIAVNAHLDAPLINLTGLNGYYDFNMKVLYGNDAPLLIDQLKQIGLKVEPRKMALTYYVVTSADQPSLDGAELADQAPVAQVSTKPATEPDVAATYVPMMTFDVASIHKSNIDEEQPHIVGGGFTQHTSHLKLQNVQPYFFMEVAYGVDDHQIKGLPEWGRTSFNIEAKSDPATDALLAKLDDKSALLEQSHMLQSLLAERFHLKTHWATQEGETYDLVIAKGGTKLMPAGSLAQTPDEVNWVKDSKVPPIHQQGDGRRGYEFFGHNCPIANLVATLGNMMGRDVVDKTGLTGNFDFHLQYNGRTVSDNRDNDPAPWPPMIDAVPDQLGLKLVPSKGQVRVLVIDRIEMPSDN
jgi:bla regulator protein BlaR1